MYEIEFSKTAERQLYKLEKKIQERIISALERIRVRPHHHLKRLVGSPYFRLRAGEYRVILDVKKGKLIIYVLEVGHRSRIYK